MAIYWSNKNGILYNDDAFSLVQRMPKNSVDCLITSPPYWGLRNYHTPKKIWGGDPNCEHDFSIQVITGDIRYRPGYNAVVGNDKKKEIYTGTGESDFCSKCGAWKGEFGLEPSFEMYLDHLVSLFEDIKRILKPTGTVWIVIGDTYNGNKTGNTDKKHSEVLKNEQRLIKEKQKQIQIKSLIGIPFRFAIQMINNGWLLRNTIIWHKPNAIPSPVKDRFTVDFEYIFFFTMKKKYFFIQQFESYTKSLNRWGGEKLIAKGKSSWSEVTGQSIYRSRSMRPNEKGRNKRTVWSINTKSFKEAHFATFPEDLIEPMVQAGSPERGVVFDPFMGSGTVAVVAQKLNRKWIGIELNEDYCEIAKRRIIDNTIKKGDKNDKKLGR